MKFAWHVWKTLHYKYKTITGHVPCCKIIVNWISTCKTIYIRFYRKCFSRETHYKMLSSIRVSYKEMKCLGTSITFHVKDLTEVKISFAVFRVVMPWHLQDYRVTTKKATINITFLTFTKYVIHNSVFLCFSSSWHFLYD